MTNPALTLENAHAHVVAVVQRSGSSFTLGMRSLPPAQRLAMFAIYAFCREVNDIADDEERSQDDRLSALEQWRDDIRRLYAGEATRLTTLALLEPVHHFQLPQAEFLGMIDGMEMDARAALQAPPLETLRLYCRRVAGTVGLLSLPVFGAKAPAAPAFALALAEALQLTNILRDTAEDAARGRLYLPQELLMRQGIPTTLSPHDVLRHQGCPAVCAELAALARRRYAEADQALARCDRRSLRPALLMMGIYEAVLDRLDRHGWHPDRAPPRLSKIAKLWAALTRGWLRHP